MEDHHACGVQAEGCNIGSCFLLTRSGWECTLLPQLKAPKPVKALGAPACVVCSERGSTCVQCTIAATVVCFVEQRCQCALLQGAVHQGAAMQAGRPLCAILKGGD